MICWLVESSMLVLRLVARVSWSWVSRSSSSSVGIKESVGIMWHIVEASKFTFTFAILWLVVLALLLNGWACIHTTCKLVSSIVLWMNFLFVQNWWLCSLLINFIFSWVVVLPVGSRTLAKPYKLELAIYSRLQVFHS